MTMKKRLSPSSDDILEPNFVQNTQIRLSDIYDKLSVMDGRLRSFEDCSHKIMDKIAILESSVQILETYAVNATLVGRHNSFGKSTLSSSMSSLLQPLTESDDEGTEALESHPEEEGMVESLSRSRSYSELHKMHHSPSLKKSSSPLKAGGSVKFRDKPSSIPRTLGGGESSRFSWSGGGPSKTVEYIKTGPLEVKKRFTGYKRYWCCLKDDLSLLLFSYPEHLRRPDLSTRHRPKYTMRLKGCYVVLREGHESEEEAHKPGGRFDFIRTDNNSIYNQFAAATYQEAKDWVQTFEEASLALNNANNGLRKKQQRRISAQSLNDLHILKRSSLDSPAGSLQEMASSSSSHPNSSSVPSSSRANGSGVPPPPPPPLPPSDSSSSQHSQHPPFWDSDFETEPDPPDWRFSMNQDDLVKLRPIEKKKQDVINEFFHTERSHVRNLKVLDRIFYRPMLDNPSLMSVDMVQRLFPNLDELIQIHTKFNQIMKDRIKSQGFPLGDISDILLEMFDGPNGDTLIELGSEFTQNQKFTMEELKKKRGRDHKFDAFLSDLERRPECRRLGLESILPVEHQRLVKYPLLLEQLSKQIPEGPSYSTIKSCVERTKFILDSIDKRVAEAQNLQRLADIQRNLDTSGLEKNPESSIPAEYKNCDLTKHRLIYDGPLTLKLGDTRRYKTVDLHVVLLEDCIMLLQKQDDKYLLKFHTSGAASSTGDKKLFHSPIIEFSTMLVRPVATDKRAFYLLNITQTVPQIYELIASSSADRSQWFRHITEASNAYRARDNRRNFRTTGGISPLPDTGISSSSSASTNGLGSSLDGNSSRKEAATASSLLGVKGILPGGRSHSFHESSSSNRESPPERQPSSPPEDIGTKSEDNSASGAGGSESTTPRKRLQRVEILKIAEPSPLIDPSQVVVTQGEILVADPVLTPIEKLRRKDLEISKALGDKQRIIADIFQIPSDDFDAIADIASQPSENKDAREVLVAALAQANSLSELLNENLNLTEEDTIAASSSSGGHSTSYQANRNLPFFRKAIQKSSNINQLLTSLLAIFQMREEERDRSRHCLQRYQDQIDVYLSDSTSCPVGRPASFISVEEETSSGLHDSEEDEEKRQASLSRNQSESQDLPPTSSVESGSSELHPEYGGGKPMLQEAEEEDIVVVKESNKVVESVVVEAKPEVISSHESDNLISLSPQEYDEEEGLLLLPETAACDVATKTEEEQHHEDEEIHESPKSSSHQATAESKASLEDEEVSKTTTADENPSASKEETSIKDDEPQS